MIQLKILSYGLHYNYPNDAELEKPPGFDFLHINPEDLP
jgi:hypothetical protein